MFQRLSGITFADLLTLDKDVCKNKVLDYLTADPDSHSVES